MSLQLFSPAERQRGIFATIVGEAGLGKTSLASLFPSPVFICTEDGLQSVSDREDVKAFPLCGTTNDVFNAVQALGTEEHEFKTVIIDSITQFATIAEHEIVEADGKAKSINQACGGYGAGQSASAEVHRKLRSWFERLQETKKMNVIVIAHAEAEVVEPPDSDSYTRYSLRMHKKSQQHWVDNVDLVAFIKLKTYLKGDAGAKKAVSKGERIITCYPTANHVSKNRFGIENDLFFNKAENPFAEFLTIK